MLIDLALDRGARWARRARRDGEGGDLRTDACDYYQAGRVSVGLVLERPPELCAARHPAAPRGACGVPPKKTSAPRAR